MAENAPVRKTRFPLWFWAVMAGLFAVLVLAIGLFLHSATFEAMVLERVVATIEKATGGKVEMGSLHWNVSKLEIEARDLTIHGREPAGEVPLAHADRLLVQLRVLSFINTDIILSQLTLDQPVVHIIVDGDGVTNLPEPQVKAGGDPIQQLFELAIGRVEVHYGIFQLNEQKQPFDFKANDVDLAMNYQRLLRRYDGTLHVGKMDARYQDYREVAASGDSEFTLWRNRAQVKTLKLVSQQSSLELSGSIDDFTHPRLQFAYGGSIDLAQLGAVARVNAMRSGGLSFSGSVNYTEDNFSSSGKLDARGVTYADGSINLRDANASTEFSLDRNQVLLKKISARLLGGTVTGDAEVKNYAPSLADSRVQIKSDRPAKGATPSTNGSSKAKSNLVNAKLGVLPVQQGAAKLKVSGASLGEVMRMLSSKALPLDNLNAAGVVNGTVDVGWRESLARATAELSLDSAVPAQSRTNQLPVSGALRGHYDVYSGALTIAQLNLATPRSEANANGVLGSRTAQLKVAATTSSLAEFQPLLSAMGQSALPVELNGRASFNGTVSGKLDHPDVAGHVLASDFTYVYTPPAPPPPAAVHGNAVESLLHLGQATPQPTPPTPEARRIHIDSFAGDIAYGRTQIALHNGVIEQGTARLNVDGSAAVTDSGFNANTPFQLRASIHNGSVADVQRTIGTNFPVSGMVNFSVEASGTQADPQGRGQLSLTGGEAYGQSIKALTADVMLANHEVGLQNIRLESVSGVVEGEAAYNMKDRQLRSDLHGDKIDLEKLTELQTSQVQAKGIGSFRIKASGTLEKPSVDAHVEVANLVLNDEYEGGLVLDAISHGSKLQVTAASKFPHGSLALNGTVDLKNDMQSDLQVQFAQIDIDPLLRGELKSHITGHSVLAGHANLTGPLRRPRTLKGGIVVDAFSVEVEKVPIHSDGPIEVALDDLVLTVSRLTMTAEDSNLTISGSVDLKGDRPLDLYAKGHLNVGLWHVLDSEVTSHGTTDADIRVQGTMAKPVMKGRVVIAHAGFSLIDLPAALGELNGTMVFNQDRLEVEQLSGRVGGGQVSFSGYMTFGKTIGFDLSANGTDIRFRYGGVSVTADQSLRLNGTLNGSTLSGEVTITRFAQVPMIDAGAAAFVSQPVEVPNPKSPLNNLRLDVRIISAPELTVQTSLAKLSGDADLRLRGTGTRPVLLGRINIAEGDINLNGTKYHLDRGDVTFANPVRIDPILDMEATTRVRDFDITIGLHGTMEKLTTTYRSDPPLSSDDIIALLAFGRTQEESQLSGHSTSLGEGAGSFVLGEAINQTVTNRVSKLFGVSSIRINPSVGGADNNPSARLTVEQQVSNNVTLTYITNLTQSAQQVIQFEYNINTEYTVEAIRDENGVVSFDLLIRKRKK